jgi:hypothetical protein
MQARLPYDSTHANSCGQVAIVAEDSVLHVAESTCRVIYAS